MKKGGKLICDRCMEAEAAYNVAYEREVYCYKCFVAMREDPEFAKKLRYIKDAETRSKKAEFFKRKIYDDRRGQKTLGDDDADDMG